MVHAPPSPSRARRPPDSKPTRIDADEPGLGLRKTHPNAGNPSRSIIWCLFHHQMTGRQDPFAGPGNLTDPPKRQATSLRPGGMGSRAAKEDITASIPDHDEGREADTAARDVDEQSAVRRPKAGIPFCHGQHTIAKSSAGGIRYPASSRYAHGVARCRGSSP
jgi:hypothetical protein